MDYVIRHEGEIYDAVATQPWSGDAAVSVSIVNWVKGEHVPLKTLWLSNGTTKVNVDRINPSLALGVDLRLAPSLDANGRPTGRP